MVIIHHFAAHTPPAQAFGSHQLLGERDRERTNSLHRKATRKIALRIGFVELLGECMRRRRFVLPIRSSNLPRMTSPA
jgi:hypothetical protein